MGHTPKTHPLPKIDAPCPLCGKQMVGMQLRVELVVYCEHCKEAFDLGDKRVTLTKKGKDELGK